MIKIEPRVVDSVTVDDLKNIEIGQIAVFKLPNFRKIRSAQSVTSYYGKIRELGKKFKTESRVVDNLLIIKAVEL